MAPNGGAGHAAAVCDGSDEEMATAVAAIVQFQDTTSMLRSRFREESDEEDEENEEWIDFLDADEGPGPGNEKNWGEGGVCEICGLRFRNILSGSPGTADVKASMQNGHRRI